MSTRLPLPAVDPHLQIARVPVSFARLLIPLVGGGGCVGSSFVSVSHLTTEAFASGYVSHQ